MFLPLSVFYNTPPSKNPSKNLCLIETLTKRLLRTLLRSTSFKEPSKNPSKTRVRLHDPLGVRPIYVFISVGEGVQVLSPHVGWQTICPCCFNVSTYWGKKVYTSLLQQGAFLCRKKWGGGCYRGKISAPPDLCLPRCVFRDCPCIW